MNFDPYVQHTHTHTHTHSETTQIKIQTTSKTVADSLMLPPQSIPLENVLELILGTCNYVVRHALPYIINRSVISGCFL